MIRESGRFEYDDILEAFYDYEGYGQHRIQQENGRFSGYGLSLIHISGFAPDYVKEAGEYAPGSFLSSAFSNRMFGPTNEDIPVSYTHL